MRNVVTLALLAGCANEPQLRNLVPVIAVAPDAVRYGDVGPPLTATEPVFVTNSGAADLEIDGIELHGDQGAFSFDVELPLVLEPGEERRIPVTFAPKTYRDYAGRISFTSNDRERRSPSVRLIGRGVDLPFPDIEILPSRTIAPDYGGEVVPVGETALMTFQIWNLGDADLRLGEIEIAGPTGQPAPQFTEVYDQSHAVVPPGQFAAVVYGYQPDDEVGDLGIVTIPSDDPDEPELVVQLDGNGAVVQPIAEIACPDEVLLTGPEWLHLSGAGSHDPSGYEPLQYAWTVTQRPDAADASVPLDPSTTEEVDLYVDVAGTWTVELRVVNTLGAVSEPAVCSFGAVPEDGLHVELSWDAASADVDLHLVQAGYDLFDVPEDCNYCNKSPRWSAAGGDDDPRLDIDDQGGFGPENINILSPPADGAYEVRVHYFDDHGDGPVVATVKVWLEGIEVYSGDKVLTWNQVWSVGTARWPSPTFTANGAVALATRRACQN